MKKFIIFILTLTVLSLCACNNDEQKGDSDSITISESAVVNSTSPSTKDRTNPQSDIEYVNEKIKEVADNDDFKSMSLVEKKDSLILLLDELIKEGLISEYSFNLDAKPAYLKYIYSYGGTGICYLEGFSKDLN